MLIHELRRTLADRHAESFRLAGEDLTSLTFEDLRAASDAYAIALDRVPASMRREVTEQHAAHGREAHAMLRRYNKDIASRVRGYVALGRSTGFELPWPTVAATGVMQIMRAALPFYVFGVAAECIGRLGLYRPSELTAEIDDATRRTNRGIFADGVPMCLFAIRCARLRRSGRGDLVDALLDGPFPLSMDETAWCMVRDLDRALSIDDGAARFEALGSLTHEHFAREQRVFSHHFGSALTFGSGPRFLRDRLRIRKSLAPAFEESGGRLRMVFRPALLPDGFDLGDHDQRVETLDRLFCRSLLRSPPHFRAAVAFVRDRFDKEHAGALPAFGAGGTPIV